MKRFGKDTDGIIQQLMKGDYPTKVIETKWGNFTVKYPTGKENARIEKLKALQLTGMPISSFSNEYLYDVHRDATLSVVISEYPEDFHEDWKAEGIDEFPDEEVKNSILKEFNTFSSKIKKEISGKPS